MSHSVAYYSRRSFLDRAAALPTLAASETRPDQMERNVQLHPLDGIGHENLKISDINLTLMSYELPRNKQWVTGMMVAWKTDAVPVQVFTNQGIVGIGESSLYGGPEAYSRSFPTAPSLFTLRQPTPGPEQGGAYDGRT